MQAVGMVDDHIDNCWRKTPKSPKGDFKKWTG
jgi:3-methyladenine DNA glycosylase Tag